MFSERYFKALKSNRCKDVVFSDWLCKKIEKFAGDDIPAVLAPVLFEFFGKLKKLKDEYGKFCVLRLVSNSIFTKRRSRFWVHYPAETCCFCDCGRDSLQHWFGLEGRCVVVRHFTQHVFGDHAEFNLKFIFSQDVEVVLRFIKTILKAHTSNINKANHDFQSVYNSLGYWKFFVTKAPNSRPRRIPDPSNYRFDDNFLSFFNGNFCILRGINPWDQRVFISGIFGEELLVESGEIDFHHNNIHVFLDGSYSPGDNLCGHGFTILGLSQSPHDFCGPIDELDAEEFGCTISNNVGELWSIPILSNFINNNINNFLNKKVIVYFDISYAINICLFKSRWRKNCNLCKKAALSLYEIRCKVNCTVRHVYSHNGHIWNIRADKLAERGAQGFNLFNHF